MNEFERNLESVPEDELRARLAAIVDSSDDAIVGKTLKGIITSWNRGAERLFGYTAEEAVGRHITLIIPEDRWAEEDDVLARLGRGERVDHFETIRQTKDGRLIPISLTVSPIRDRHGRIVGASKVARDITERVERQRAQLVTRMVLAQEEERRRLARELHDQLGQQLTALRLTLETLKTQALENTEFRAQVQRLQELAQQLDQDIAFRVWELRPVALERLGLAAALAEHAGNWSQRFGIRAELYVSRPHEQRLPPDIETTIYRVAQEALNNVVKHARADRVDIALEYVGDSVRLIIEDDGIGFNVRQAETAATGLGLIGMRERSALAGADLRIESAPGKGTTVILRVPATAIRRSA